MAICCNAIQGLRGLRQQPPDLFFLLYRRSWGGPLFFICLWFFFLVAQKVAPVGQPQTACGLFSMPGGPFSTPRRCFQWEGAAGPCHRGLNGAICNSTLLSPLRNRAVGACCSPVVMSTLETRRPQLPRMTTKWVGEGPSISFCADARLRRPGRGDAGGQRRFFFRKENILFGFLTSFSRGE